jgi:hypothetical protein
MYPDFEIIAIKNIFTFSFALLYCHLTISKQHAAVGGTFRKKPCCCATLFKPGIVLVLCSSRRNILRRSMLSVDRIPILIMNSFKRGHSMFFLYLKDHPLLPHGQ